MSKIEDVAAPFLAALKAGDYAKAEAFWSEDVVSRENMKGPMQVTRGRKATHAKGVWWFENHEVHSFEAEGPFYHGQQFALLLRLDVTRKADKERIKMSEVALYKVKDGKIVEERFFY